MFTIPKRVVYGIVLPTLPYFHNPLMCQLVCCFSLRTWLPRNWGAGWLRWYEVGPLRVPREAMVGMGPLPMGFGGDISGPKYIGDWGLGTTYIPLLLVVDHPVFNINLVGNMLVHHLQEWWFQFLIQPSLSQNYDHVVWSYSSAVWIVYILIVCKWNPYIFLVNSLLLFGECPQSPFLASQDPCLLFI